MALTPETDADKRRLLSKFDMALALGAAGAGAPAAGMSAAQFAQANLARGAHQAPRIARGATAIGRGATAARNATNVLRAGGTAARGAALGARAGGSLLTNPVTGAVLAGTLIGNEAGKRLYETDAGRAAAMALGGTAMLGNPSEQGGAGGILGRTGQVMSFLADPFGSGGRDQKFVSGPADANGDGYTSEAEFDAHAQAKFGGPVGSGPTRALSLPTSGNTAQASSQSLRDFLAGEGLLGADPYEGIRDQMQQELSDVDARYQADLASLRGQFQLAETPEEKLALARQVKGLEDQRDAAVGVITNAYNQGAAALDESSAEREAEQAARVEAITSGNAARQGSTAGVIDEALLGPGVGFMPRLEQGSGEQFLSDAGTQELALAQALGQVASDGARFLNDGLLGPEQAAQQADMQRFAMGQIANTQARHAQQVAQRINEDRRFLSQAEIALSGQRNSDRTSLLNGILSATGHESLAEQALLADAIDRYGQQNDPALNGAFDPRRQAIASALVGPDFDPSRFAPGIDPVEQPEAFAQATQNAQQFAASLALAVQNGQFNVADPGAWQAVMETIAGSDPAGFTNFMLAQYGTLDPYALAAMHQGG